MYSIEAWRLRRCTAQIRRGGACRCYAVWGDPLQRCAAHGGRRPLHHDPCGRRPDYRTNYTPCTCPAYEWPHRPGGGACDWPNPPAHRCTIPAGTHSWPRTRYDSAVGQLALALRGYRLS